MINYKNLTLEKILDLKCTPKEKIYHFNNWEYYCIQQSTITPQKIQDYYDGIINNKKKFTVLERFITKI